MKWHEDIQKALLAEGYEHVTISENGNRLNVHAQPAQLDESTHRYRSYEILKNQGCIIHSCEVWMGTEVCVVSARKVPSNA